MIRAYLAARWQGSALRGELDDAVQQVFVECYKDGGVLERVAGKAEPGFRAFLFGVARNGPTMPAACQLVPEVRRLRSSNSTWRAPRSPR